MRKDTVPNFSFWNEKAEQHSTAQAFDQRDPQNQFLKTKYPNQQLAHNNHRRDVYKFKKTLSKIRNIDLISNLANIKLTLYNIIYNNYNYIQLSI